MDGVIKKFKKKYMIKYIFNAWRAIGKVIKGIEVKIDLFCPLFENFLHFTQF